MLFNEIYSSYYNVMAKIIASAVKGDLSKDGILRITNENAFSESFMEIVPAIESGKWQLITRDYETPLKNVPTMPLTDLQKRWLKAITLDPRFKLFDVSIEGLEDVKPLFTPEDYYVLDRYADGDPYEDERYIENFRTVLYAIRNGKGIGIRYVNHTGHERNILCRPTGLEYSEKDDKFRAVMGDSDNGQINIQRIIRCSVLKKEKSSNVCGYPVRTDSVVFEVKDERNALERVMLEFAYYRKQAERTDDGKYRVRLWYDRSDGTEILIRILSFGPVVKVISPESFINEIRERLSRQKSCGL